MPILFRYLFREYAKIFMMCFSGLMTVYLVIDFFEKVRRFLRYDADWLDVLTYFLLKVPAISFQIAPLAILTFIVIGTGLIKSARYFFGIPVDVVAWATWLHGWSTWLTVIVLGAHLAAIFLVPRNWPGIGSMIRGRMPLRLVEHEFPAWADEIERAGPEPTTAGPRAHAPGTVGGP